MRDLKIRPGMDTPKAKLKNPAPKDADSLLKQHMDKRQREKEPESRDPVRYATDRVEKNMRETKSEIRPYLRKIAEVQKAQMPPRRSVGGRKPYRTQKPPIGGTLPRKEQQSGTLYLHRPTVEAQRPLRRKAIRAHRSRAVLPPRADRS